MSEIGMSFEVIFPNIGNFLQYIFDFFVSNLVVETLIHSCYSHRYGMYNIVPVSITGQRGHKPMNIDMAMSIIK